MQSKIVEFLPCFSSFLFWGPSRWLTHTRRPTHFTLLSVFFLFWRGEVDGNCDTTARRGKRNRREDRRERERKRHTDRSTSGAFAVVLFQFPIEKKKRKKKENRKKKGGVTVYCSLPRLWPPLTPPLLPPAAPPDVLILPPEAAETMVMGAPCCWSGCCCWLIMARMRR